jgi:hypothetical protein
VPRFLRERPLWPESTRLQYCDTFSRLRIAHRLIEDQSDIRLPGRASKRLSRTVIGAISPERTASIKRNLRQVNPGTPRSRKEQRLRRSCDLAKAIAVSHKSPAPITHLRTGSPFFRSRIQHARVRQSTKARPVGRRRIAEGRCQQIMKARRIRRNWRLAVLDNPFQQILLVRIAGGETQSRDYVLRLYRAPTLHRGTFPAVRDALLTPGCRWSPRLLHATHPGTELRERTIRSHPIMMRAQPEGPDYDCGATSVKVHHVLR